MAGWSGSLKAILSTQIATATTARLTRNVDTTDSMLTAGGGSSPAGPDAGALPPPGPPPPLPATSRWRPGHVALVALAVVVTVVGVGGALIRLPYDSLAPGSARRVDDIIAVNGHPVYPPEGKVLFTTVSVRERINVWEALAGWIDADVDVTPEENVRGKLPPEEFRRLNVEAMADSKTAAEAVVLRRLGFVDLEVGAEVTSIEPNLPVGGVVEPGDVIVAIDDRPVSTPAEAVAAVRARQPGDTVRLSVVRSGAPPAERATTLGRNDEGQALLGVTLAPKLELPFEIAIDSGTVEGPSAGLAYTLALLDELTPGELTGGANVAVTGEMDAEGKVGAVGGVGQKVAAVRRSGAALFLVPTENLDEARSRAGDLEVKGVDTFDDALRALAALPGSNAGSLAPPAAG